LGIKLIFHKIIKPWVLNVFLVFNISFMNNKSAMCLLHILAPYFYLLLCSFHSWSLSTSREKELIRKKIPCNGTHDKLKHVNPYLIMVGMSNIVMGPSFYSLEESRKINSSSYCFFCKGRLLGVIWIPLSLIILNILYFPTNTRYQCWLCN